MAAADTRGVATTTDDLKPAALPRQAAAESRASILAASPKLAAAPLPQQASAPAARPHRRASAGSSPAASLRAEGADEGVAGAGGVHHLDRMRAAGVRRRRTAAEDGALCAERDHHSLGDGLQQGLADGVRLGAAAEREALDLVGHQDVGQGEKLPIDLLRRRSDIENGAHTVRASQAEGFAGGVDRRLELGQDQAGAGDGLRRRADVPGREARVGAEVDHDRVLAVGVHQDHRRPGARIGQAGDGAGVDPGGAPGLQRLFTGGVHADRGEHGDARAAAGGLDRLVGALAARRFQPAEAEAGLTWGGEVGDRKGDVAVVASHHDNLGRHHAPPPRPPAKRWELVELRAP